MIDDTVHGRTDDHPALLPLWKVAEPMGAVMCMPQRGETLLRQRSARDHLPNTIGRMDRGWQVRCEAWVNGPRPPSAALSKVSADGLTHSEEALRDRIDTIGIDRVVFGTDGPP